MRFAFRHQRCSSRTPAEEHWQLLSKKHRSSFGEPGRVSARSRESRADFCTPIANATWLAICYHVRNMSENYLHRRLLPAHGYILLAGLGYWLSVGLTRADGPRDDAIPVRVDERVELLSIVFRLAGAREYSQTAKIVPYAKDVDEHFGRFKDHEAIKLAQKLRGERGIGYDAVASFALHIQGNPRLDPKFPFDPKPSELDRRWSPKSASGFLAGLQRFADDSHAFDFFERHKALYAKSTARLAQELAKRPYRRWLDSFFGAKPDAKFCAIVGLLNGGSNYGCKVRYPDGHEEILPVLGVDRFDAAGLPVFDKGTSGLAAHEFCHSYCNPLVDRFADQLLAPAEKVYPHRARLLRDQAYTSARTMLYESFVRACTHRFLCAHGTPAEAAAQLREEVGRGFFWTPQLSDLLLSYERSREKYSTIETFMPAIVKFFEDLGNSIDERLSRFPYVVRLTPQNGATDVDPALTELRIEFDRPMKPASYSIVGNKVRIPTMPIAGHFSDDAKTFVQPIKLQPGRSYTFSLNNIYYSGFASADGLPLDPVAVKFTTASSR